MPETVSLKEALRAALEEDDKTATAWLMEAESYTKLNNDVGDAVRKLAPTGGWAYIEELFDDSVVYQVGGENKATQYFKAPYAVGVGGSITLGEAVEVQKVTTYPTASTPRTEAAERSEMTFVEEAGVLIPVEVEV